MSWRTVLSIFVFFAVLDAPAYACSCVIDNAKKSAESEFEDADIIIFGYIIGQQMTSIKACNTYSPDTSEFAPLDQFKVVKGVKGISDGKVFSAKLGGVFPSRFDENCDLVTTEGHSCLHSFQPSWFGNADTPAWIAFSLRNGELWSNSKNCSTFPEYAERLASKYSKVNTK